MCRPMTCLVNYSLMVFLVIVSIMKTSLGYPRKLNLCCSSSCYKQIKAAMLCLMLAGSHFFNLNP